VLASVPTAPGRTCSGCQLGATTATVSRRDTRLQLTYDGEPQFKAIEGTSMSYAVNAQLPVIRTGKYYALENGVVHGRVAHRPGSRRGSAGKIYSRPNPRFIAALPGV
jgi:hypothetical protein